MKDVQTYLDRIHPERMRDTLWRLVSIPSPTGHEQEAAAGFADLLSQAGAEVRFDDALPNSPNVIGWLNGNRPGPVLQLAGHLDHIDIPHAPPKKESDRISGRGSADMKNGLAGILEIIHILRETGCRFPGRILVTAYGLHEAPEGDSAGLLNLLKQGVKGDAALVFEGPCDGAAVMANGMAIWNLTLSHTEPPCHELCTQRDPFELPAAAADVLRELGRKNQKLKEQPKPYPLLPPESVFVGQVHYGDFYNRLSASCFMQGTRRWNPGKTFPMIQEDFRQVLGSVVLPRGVSAWDSWMLVGDSYALDSREKIVQCLQKAYEHLHQKPLPVKGHSSVTDACRFVNYGKIPAVLWGFGTDTGHADYEYVTDEQLLRSCRVALLTVLNYFHHS
jgi:acetylornithine deacetylase/succinyl-diaminopimelate desuccinylase-like protein